MKKLVIALLVLGSFSSFASDLRGCKDSMADWLNSYHTVEQKEVIISKFCSAFKGNYKALSSCLDGAYAWNNSSDVDHKYDVALITCSKASKKFHDYFSTSANATNDIFTITERAKICLQKEWKKHSFIYDAKARRLNAASICSHKLD